MDDLFYIVLLKEGISLTTTPYSEVTVAMTSIIFISWFTVAVAWGTIGTR